MNPWPHDDNASLIAFYGDPSKPAWATQNLVPFIPPWKMLYTGDNGKVSPVTHFIVHRKIHDPLARVFASLWKHCSMTQSLVEQYGLQWYGGCYAPRPVRGSTTKMSVHSFAAAIDLDPSHEPMNHGHVSHWPQFVLDAFKVEFFDWGGDWHSRQDPMHWEGAHQ